MTDLGAPANGNGHAEPPRAQRCETCMWLHVEKRKPSGAIDVGACRRYPPQLLMVPEPTVVMTPKGPQQSIALKPIAPFVPVDPNSWCGEWAEGPQAIEGRLEGIRAALRSTPAT